MLHALLPSATHVPCYVYEATNVKIPNIVIFCLAGIISPGSTSRLPEELNVKVAVIVLARKKMIMLGILILVASYA